MHHAFLTPYQQPNQDGMLLELRTLSDKISLSPLTIGSVTTGRRISLSLPGGSPHPSVTKRVDLGTKHNIKAK